jgi:hypothetical protein
LKIAFILRFSKITGSHYLFVAGFEKLEAARKNAKPFLKNRNFIIKIIIITFKR